MLRPTGVIDDEADKKEIAGGLLKLLGSVSNKAIPF